MSTYAEPCMPLVYAHSRALLLRFRVLDECDEMLNMGFVEDVEKILGAGNVPAAVQTLLFSATLPAWVKDITARFLRPDHRVIDLVGNQRMKVFYHRPVDPVGFPL